MTDTFETLRTGGSATLRWSGVHAAKLGPYPVPVRVAACAYSIHQGDGPGGAAWMRLFYDGDLVGESGGEEVPIALRMRYETGLSGGASAAFRIDFGNRGAAIEDFGFEFMLSPI